MMFDSNREGLYCTGNLITTIIMHFPRCELGVGWLFDVSDAM